MAGNYVDARAAEGDVTASLGNSGKKDTGYYLRIDNGRGALYLSNLHLSELWSLAMALHGGIDFRLRNGGQVESDQTKGGGVCLVHQCEGGGQSITTLYFTDPEAQWLVNLLMDWSRGVFEEKKADGDPDPTGPGGA